jgi:hypothetical protein
MLGAHTVSAAPAGLAATVASTAIAGTAAGTGITLTLIELMTHAKAKFAAAVAIGAVVTTPLVWQENALAKVRAQNRALAAQIDSQDQVRAPSAGAVALPNVGEGDRDREDLDRLRKEVAAVRSQLQEARTARLAAAGAGRSAGRSAFAPPPGAIPLQDARDVGTATGTDLVQTFFWAMFTVNTNRLFEIGDWSAEGAVKEFEELMRTAGRAIEEMKTRPLIELAFRPVREIPLPDGDTAVVFEEFSGDDNSTHRTAFRVRRSGNEWRMVIGKGGPQEVKLSEEMLRE